MQASSVEFCPTSHFWIVLTLSNTCLYPECSALPPWCHSVPLSTSYLEHLSRPFTPALFSKKPSLRRSHHSLLSPAQYSALLIWNSYALAALHMPGLYQAPISHLCTRSSLGQAPPLYVHWDQQEACIHRDAEKCDLSKFAANCIMEILGILKRKKQSYF